MASRKEPKPKRTSRKRTPAQSSAPPAVVGIGASAGGLAALRTFFAHVPPDSGLAWVVVVHLSAEHESHLADLLQPHVAMPVQQVSETVPLERDHVYVIPPGANLTSVDTHLRPSKMDGSRQQRAPIDHFFRTLAKTHDGHAIGIVLTGTGSDGALGIKAIKERNGFAVVQDPGEAEYDGMPQAAISTGLVDQVLRLAEIPGAVIRFARTEPRVQVPGDGEDVAADQRQLLHKIFAQLQARTGRDFSQYKRSTLLRRIQRRMQIRQVEELPAYLDLLRADPQEVQSLADDLLITVTNFFRDPETWRQLETDIIPSFFEGKGSRDAVRAWSVGCATGEEAYSLAMLLLEEAARRENAPAVQVFASDLHERSLERAREGFYPGDIDADVSPERLRRFFHKEGGGYRVKKEVRERVIFAPHNLLRDPPFSRLDLVSCRNVMIYLQRDVQHEIVELFHYALRPDGVLVLGTSETVDNGELFRGERKGHAIFRKRNVRVREPRLPVFPMTYAHVESHRAVESVLAPAAYGAVHQRLVERYGPPSILVGRDGHVVHLSEHAGRYLVLPGGEPTMSAFRLVRPELRLELRALLRTALEGKAPQRSRPIPVRFNGDVGRVVIDVRPALEPEQEGLALVIFDERAPEEAQPAPEAGDGGSPREADLEAELEETRKRQQALIEEYETSQEEMKASSEELQSANEELRSTLEELETSKEELQSMNEELQAVNQENRHKVEELSQLSADLQNLLSSTEIATLFLDRDLRILRFTRNVGELFNVRAVDRGRPLSDLTTRIGYPELEEDARQVLRSLDPVEREVKGEAGRWYLTRILPYRGGEDRIEGVVLTFLDVTSRRRSEQALRGSEERNRLIVESARDYAILTTDTSGFIETWSFGAESVFGWSADEVVGQPIDVTFTPEDRARGVPASERETARRAGAAPDVRWHVGKDGERIFIEGSVRALSDGTGNLHGFLKIGRDLTQRREVEEALRQSQLRLENALGTARMAAWEWEPATDRLIASDTMADIFGLLPRDTFESSAQAYALVYPEDRARHAAVVRRAGERGEGWHAEFRIIRPRDGATAWLEERATPRRDDRTGHITITGLVWDITERKRADEAVRASERRLKEVLDMDVVGVLFFDRQGTLVDCNRAFLALTGYTREQVDSGRLNWRSMTPPEWIDISEQQRQLLAPTGRLGPYEKELLRADGTRSWMLFAGALLADGTVVEFCIDISDRKRAEAELREAREQLEARVLERTAELARTNDELAAALGEREKAEEARRLVLRQLVTAEEDERRRISRELHDQMGQQLTGLLLGLRAVRQEARLPDMAERLEALESLAGDVSRELQHLALELRPPVLDNLGLEAALESHLAEWGERQGIEYDFHAHGLDHASLAAEVETTIYRAVQEGLTNVLKHSGAKHVSLILERRDGTLNAILEDNGSGFDLDEIQSSPEKSRRLGLRGMRERVALLGGDIEIESSPGAGTTLFVRIPDAAPPPEGEEAR